MPVRPLWIIFAASLSQHVTHLFPPCVGATLYWCPSYVGTTLVSVLCRYNTRVRLISGATLVCLVSMQHSCPSCVGTTLVSVLCRYNTCVRRVSITPVYVFLLVQVYVFCLYKSICICHESVQNVCPFRISIQYVSILSQYNACARLVSVHVYPSCVSTTCVSVLCQYNMRVRLTLVQLACPSCVSTTCVSVFCQYKMLCLSNVHLQKNEVKAAQCHIPRLEENKKFKSLFF